MRKKKILAMALVAMLSLSGLTGCSDKDKADISNKLNNKTTETTKKEDSKADDKTSESKPDNKSDNKKSDSNSSSASKPNSNKPADKPADKPAKPNGNTGSNKSDSSTSKPSQSTEKPAETKPSQPAHQHTWVDHTATKKVPRTVHHDAVYEDVTIPAVTQTQYRCFGCNQWFNSLEALNAHAFGVQIGAESGDPNKCGSTGTGATREYVITPAYTEHRLVKDAWDETVYDVQTYVDYQECTGCHEHRQK